MPPQDDYTTGSVQSYAGEHEYDLETPFLQSFTAVSKEASVAGEQLPVASSWYETETPFSEVREALEGHGPEAEDLAELLAELEYEGFNDAINR